VQAEFARLVIVTCFGSIPGIRLKALNQRRNSVSMPQVENVILGYGIAAGQNPGSFSLIRAP
jgi:hypothetical protein